jgi:hypothetical protein
LLHFRGLASQDPFLAFVPRFVVGSIQPIGSRLWLEKLVIEGYYAKNWPAYLEERMGVQVRAICGHCRQERELKEGDLNDEELSVEKLILETNEGLQTFREYQQGTEDLIP